MNYITDANDSARAALKISSTPGVSTTEIAAAWANAEFGVIPIQGMAATDAMREKTPMSFPGDDALLRSASIETQSSITWHAANYLTRVGDSYVNEGAKFTWGGLSSEGFEHVFSQVTAVGIVPPEDFLILDADTPEEVESLRAWWEVVTGEALPPATVQTPGTDKHSDGGHWYVRLPDDFQNVAGDLGDAEGIEVDSDLLRGTINIGDGGDHFMVKRSLGGYVLAPGSIRTKGVYEVTGDIIDADENLANALVEPFIRSMRVKAVPFDAEAYEGDAADRIETWADGVTWDELLNHKSVPGSFFLTGKVSECGCPIWKYSGSDHAKSITEHVRCELEGSIHVWSQTVVSELGLDQDHFSKWGWWKEVVNQGDTDAAFRSAGIHKEAPGTVKVNPAAASLDFQNLVAQSASEALGTPIAIQAPVLAYQEPSEVRMPVQRQLSADAVTPFPQLAAQSPAVVETAPTVAQTVAPTPFVPGAGVTRAQEKLAAAQKTAEEAARAVESAHDTVDEPFAVERAQKSLEDAQEAVRAAEEEVTEAVREQHLASLNDLDWVLATHPEIATTLPVDSEGLVDFTDVNRLIVRDRYQNEMAPLIKARVDAASAIAVEDYAKPVDVNTWAERRKNRTRLSLVYAGLFYRTRIHSIAAKPGAGKSWLALAACIDAIEMNFGGRAVYLDLEDNGRAEMEDRAMMLGLAPKFIMDGRLSIISPEDFMVQGESSDPKKIIAGIIAGWIKNPPALVVIDSMAKFLRYFGMDPNSESDVVAMISMLTPLRRQEKTCIIFVDHVGHAATERPSGSQHKIGQIDLTYVMKRFERSEAEDMEHPNTALAASIHRVKDRFPGTSEIESPDTPDHIATFILENVVDASGTPRRVHVPGVDDDDPDYAEVTMMERRVITGKASAAKKHRELEERADSQREMHGNQLRSILRSGAMAAGPLDDALREASLSQAEARSLRKAVEDGEVPGVMMEKVERKSVYRLV